MTLAAMPACQWAFANSRQTWCLSQFRNTDTSDGKQILDGDDVEKWDIKDGLFIEIPPNGDRPHYFTILLLTKHEFLAQETSHGHGYLFLTRSGVDGP
jgi:hypothetical protein